MVVCECRGLTEDAVRAVIRAGCDTLPQLEIVCGVGVECGSCRNTLQCLLVDETRPDTGSPGLDLAASGSPA
jgi:bacterioferritin-associated ferredoxin